MSVYSYLKDNIQFYFQYLFGKQISSSINHGCRDVFDVQETSGSKKKKFNADIELNNVSCLYLKPEILDRQNNNKKMAYNLPIIYQ